MNARNGLGLTFVLCAVVASSVFAKEDVPEVDRTKSKMSYIENGRIKLGVDLNVGGAVTYLSELGKDENLINSTDWGRQIQMSFYSGPIPFEPNGKKPMHFWRGIGWNPIQAGDSYAHGSKVIEHRNEGDKLYIKCIPMQWPLDNEPGECTFECWYELDGNVVKGRYKLNNARNDKRQYPARNQELPAVYANGRWSRIFTYVGGEPFTGAPLTEIVHIWKGGPTDEPWGRWQTPERWAAAVDKAGRGIGVWSQRATEFNGGYFGTVIGEGGPTDSQSNYLGPVRKEIIDHNIEYEYTTHYIVGSLEEIRQYVYEKTPRMVSPDYQFKGSRDGWAYEGATDSGWPIRDGLDIVFSAGEVLISGPTDFWRAQDVPEIHIKAALKSGGSCNLLWKTSKSSNFSDARSKPVEMIGDGVPRVYTIDLSDCPAYQGGITQIALKMESAAPGDTLRIDYVSLKNAKPGLLDDFIIMAYSGPPLEETTLERYQEVADAGIGYLCPGNGVFNLENNLMAMDLAKEVGIKIIPVDMRMLPFALKPDIDLDETVIRQIARDYRSHPALGGYLVRDEPDANMFPTLRAISDVLRSEAPAYEPLINLFPNYGTIHQFGVADYTTYIRDYLKIVEPGLLAYDSYPLRNGGVTIYDDWYGNLEIVREEARKAKIPFLVFIQSEGIKEGLRVPNRAEILWQANTVLAYGAQGVGWFCYWTPESDQGFPQAEGAKAPVVESHYNAMINIDGERTELYDYVREANLYLKKVGSGLLGWDNMAVARYEAGKMLEGGSSPIAAPEGAGANIVMGTFRKGDNVRLVIANSSCEKPAAFSLKLSSGRKVEGVFALIDTEPIGELTWKLKPGGSIVLDAM